MHVPSDLLISTWPICAPPAKQVFWGLLGAESHQASVECTLVMKHQGVRQIRFSFHKLFAYNYYDVSVSDCGRCYAGIEGETLKTISPRTRGVGVE